MSEDYINEPWTEAHVHRYMREACFSDLVHLCIFLKAGQQEWKDKTRAYEAAIRKHRDQRGDDRCWMDDEELYKALPEGYTPPERDTAVELRNCEIFLACRKNPATTYVSPQREIEALHAKLDKAKEALQLGLDIGDHGLPHGPVEARFTQLAKEAIAESEKP
jgi:hypothetical protein